MVVRRLSVVSLLPVALWQIGLVGCGSSRCTEPATDAPEAPAVTVFDVHSQLDGDPWTVVFEIGFTDTDGDLGNGLAEFFLGGELSEVSRLLFDVFRQSGVPLDATDGAIAIPLRFGEDISDGASVRFATQLIDEAGNRSNCASFELTFDVEPL